MTQPGRGWGPRALVFFALILFVWSHRHALTLTGFADDLGLLVELPERAAQHTLFADMAARIVGPLWPGSLMWRPLPYASFGVDALLWGNLSEAWRLTNLLLHLGCAAFTGLISARLTRAPLAGAAGFAVFLLMPWAPEVTIWLVGRFDGWATLGMLVALWCVLKSNRFDRWFAVSLLAAAAAYASKESAIILPLWVIVISVAGEIGGAQTGAAHQTAWPARVRIALHARWPLIVAHIALACAYYLWRAHLFAGASVNAYAGTAPDTLMQLLSRLIAHAGFAGGLAVQAPVAAWVSAAGAASLLAFGSRGRAKSMIIVGGLLACSVFAALAVYFADAPHAGEGYRLYYLATVGMALMLAAGVASVQRVNMIVIVVLIVALATWQSRTTAEWTRASRAMRDAQIALQATAASLPTIDYGLVLMPDMSGHVPFARNAQGAVISHATANSSGLDVLSRLIVFTPPQLAEWYGLMQQDIVPKLTARKDAPVRPTRYFCFKSGTQQLQDLGYWPAESQVTWIAQWRDKAKLFCPDLIR